MNGIIFVSTEFSHVFMTAEQTKVNGMQFTQTNLINYVLSDWNSFM
jgi:hypothetical protein